MATGELVTELTGHRAAVESVVQYFPQTALESSPAPMTKQSNWSVSTGETVGEPLQGHRECVISVAVPPDGTLIASGSMDRTVRI